MRGHSLCSCALPLAQGLSLPRRTRPLLHLCPVLRPCPHVLWDLGHAEGGDRSVLGGRGQIGEDGVGNGI